MFEECECVGDGRRTKENPADRNQRERHAHSENLAKRRERGIFGDDSGFFFLRSAQKPRYEKQPVEKPPHDKCPICAVPKSANREDNQRVANRFGFAFARAAKRNIQVIAKPRVERNMPAPPKLRNVARKIREAKIRADFDAEKFRTPDCHVRIAGKIAVNLNRIKHGDDEQRAPAERRVIAPNRVHRFRAIVGDDHFFEKSPKHLPQAVRRERVVKNAFLRVLRHEFGRAPDRSREKLREKTQIGENVDGIFRDGNVPAIKINRVAERGKRVKRNADGKNDREQPSFRTTAEKGVDKLADEKIAVLENAENGEIRDDVCAAEKFSRA